MRPDTHSLGVADNAKDEAQNTHKLGGGRKEKKKKRKEEKIDLAYWFSVLHETSSKVVRVAKHIAKQSSPCLTWG